MKKILISFALCISMGSLASNDIVSMEKENKKKDLQELKAQEWFKVISSDKAGDYYLNVKYIQLIPNKINQFSMDKSKWSKSVDVWIRKNSIQDNDKKFTYESEYSMMLANFNCDRKTIYIKQFSLFYPNNSESNISFSGAELQSKEELVVPETINDELLQTSCFIRFLMIN